MNNGAILRQTPALLISRWLIDPNGNVYQRDSKDKNIIILSCLIAVFEGGGPKGNFWMFEIIGKVDFRASSVVLSLRVRSHFIVLIKGYEIFNIIYLNNLARELKIVVIERQRHEILVARYQCSGVSHTHPTLRTQTPLIHQNSITQDPSKQFPTAKTECFYFSEDHKYTHNFSINFFFWLPFSKQFGLLFSPDFVSPPLSPWVRG